ncbi:MAG: GNAT family N-acetyltransferase [Halothece sp. Uz-M2-17]|nr:GNAT family N-acetyltransferase [Halothece sp. Uz-M2-17]
MVTSQTNVTIQPVTTPAEKEQFIKVPWQVYKNDPNWVPPLKSETEKELSSENPFNDYGRFQAFIALNAGKTAVGRIVAAVNDRLLAKEGQNIGFFGFFECIEDQAVANALFEAAETWLREQGMIAMRGPIDLSTHNNCLWLVDGFDSPPKIMMPYNPPYYENFILARGGEIAKTAYAYHLPLQGGLGEKFARAYRIASRSGIRFRPFNTKGDAFEADVSQIYELFNLLFEDSWSSTPRTKEEFMAQARSLQDLVDPDIFPIAEYNGEMIGFFMALPDYNVALKHVNGKLNWWGILKFLWYRRQIKQGRVLVICCRPEYRRKMVPLALIHAAFQQGKSYHNAELSWVYDDNSPSRRLIEETGAKIYKTYRMYEKAL